MLALTNATIISLEQMTDARFNRLDLMDILQPPYYMSRILKVYFADYDQ